MFLGLLFLLLPALAESNVATVDISTFQVGKHWTWEYRSADGQLYSTERYTVVGVVKNEVMIEMSTAFPAVGVFNAHHRLRVPLDRCLFAYKNPYSVTPWSFKMYSRAGEKWDEFVAPSTLAFEEKFNCNPHRNDSNSYLTVFRDSSDGELFMHKLWRRLPGTWFMNEGEDRGIALEKEFRHSAHGPVYYMKLLR